MSACLSTHEFVSPNDDVHWEIMNTSGIAISGLQGEDPNKAASSPALRRSARAKPAPRASTATAVHPAVTGYVASAGSEKYVQAASTDRARVDLVEWEIMNTPGVAINTSTASKRKKRPNVEAPSPNVPGILPPACSSDRMMALQLASPSSAPSSSADGMMALPLASWATSSVQQEMAAAPNLALQQCAIAATAVHTARHSVMVPSSAQPSLAADPEPALGASATTAIYPASHLASSGLDDCYDGWTASTSAQTHRAHGDLDLEESPLSPADVRESETLLISWITQRHDWSSILADLEVPRVPKGVLEKVLNTALLKSLPRDHDHAAPSQQHASVTPSLVFLKGRTASCDTMTPSTDVTVTRSFSSGSRRYDRLRRAHLKSSQRFPKTKSSIRLTYLTI